MAHGEHGIHTALPALLPAEDAEPALKLCGSPCLAHGQRWPLEPGRSVSRNATRATVSSWASGVWPAVGMGQGNKLPDCPIQRGPLGSGLLR